MSTNALDLPSLSYLLTLNRLYFGDHLHVLRTHIADASVDLCYIDPPFNSKRNYNQIYGKIGVADRAQAQAFIDTWIWNTIAEQGLNEILDNEKGRFTSDTIQLIEGFRNILTKESLFAYLVSMTLRIVEIHRVLKPTGSFYLHCDHTASHYLKILLDAVFGPEHFRNEIVWKRTSAHANVGKRYAVVQDRLLFYTKSDEWTWNQVYLPYSQDYITSHYGQVEPETHRAFTTRDLTASMQRASRGQIYDWQGVRPPASRCWAYTQDRMAAFDAQGRLVYSPRGMPRLKLYLDDMPGTPCDDVWSNIDPINSQAIERIGYPTQKPQALLERIIKSSSREGDIVLDAYCGCGTTVAVAQELRRHWIALILPTSLSH